MLKRLLGRMAGDITDLIKKDLLLVQEVVDLDSLSASERADYLAKAHELWANPVFQDLCRNIVKLQHEETLANAETKEQLWAGRCNIATASLFRDEAEKLNARFEALRKDDGFNKYSII